MKTKNNAQKTGNRKHQSRVLTIGVSLLAFGLVLSANSLMKSSTSTSNDEKMILAPVQLNSTFNEIGLNHNSLIASLNFEAVEKENNLELESWMINNSNFNGTNFSEQIETEKPLELQDWMTDISLFGNSSLNEEIENENTLQLEDWMIENPNFNTQHDAIEFEPELKIESWMTNASIWI